MSRLSSRVLILKAEVSATAVEQPTSYQLLHLPNPSTGQQQQYILTGTSLLEVNRVKHPHTCWLVDNTFISDGSAYLATPINAVYVLLALLQQQDEQQATSMYQEAESLLCSEAWPAAQQLLGLAQQHLPCICDVKALEDITYYKLNPNRVLAFLRVCVRRTLTAFESQSPASIAGLSSEDQQTYVLKFLKEYIPPAWHDKLVLSYGIELNAFNSGEAGGPAVRPALAAATNHTAETADKRPKLDPKEAARKKAEETRAAAAAAKLKKDAAGTKKISSFFAAKKG